MATSQYALGIAYHETPDACIDDITPPTFAGIVSLTPTSLGGLTAAWAAATDPTAPIRYNVYVKLGTATGLFSETPFITEALSLTIYEDANGPLAYSETYFVGVRAVDAVGNVNTNTVSLSAISSGVIAGAIKYECFASLAITPDNELAGALFLHGDGKAVKTGLGVASFKLFDSTDTEIVSFAQSGLTANAAGVYLLTPVSAAALDPFTYYRAQIVIVHDAANIESYVGVQLGE